MSQSVTVAATIAKIREAADMETLAPSKDVVTDDELVSVIDDAHRALYDLIADVTGHEIFGTSATVTVAGGFALPSDFYRVLGVDIPNFFGTGQPFSVQPYSFLGRNRRAAAAIASGYVIPTYRIQNGSLVWEPTSAAPTEDVTLWYVPTPSALASGGSFDAFNGWDQYVVWWGVRYCKDKQEEDSRMAYTRFKEAEARVQRNASRFSTESVTVADIYGDSAEQYYNS